MTTLISVTTANICGNPIRRLIFVNRRITRAMKESRGGIVMGQELARKNKGYQPAWKRIASKYGKTTYGGTEDLISIDKEMWGVRRAYTVHVHDGLAKVSPDRFFEVVLAVRHTGEDVAFIDGHPISKPRPGVPHAKFRMNMWDLYHARLSQEVKTLNEQGYTVVFGGDMNKVKVPQIHPKQITLTQSGLDHLWVVPAEGYRVHIRDRWKVAPTSKMDHPILTVRFELAKVA